MKLFLLGTIAGLVFFFYPQVNEEADNSCHALERRVIGVLASSPGGSRADEALGRAFLGALAGEFSRGSLASGFIKQQYPNIPPFAGCTIMYWRVVLDSSSVAQLARQAGLKQ
jgi:hypothetical protein